MTTDQARRSIPETVTRSLPTLSAGERAAARALLADYPISGLETLSKFAQRAAVSAPTVLRFVVKLGFDGYPEFQRVIREEIQQRVTSPAARFPAPGHDPRNILGGFTRITELIDRTREASDPAELEAVAADLARAPRLSALGGRVTSLLAHHLTHQLAQLRPSVTLLPAGSTRLLERTIDLSAKDTIVVFDTRRYQDDTHRFAKLASERGATIILLTDPLLSPISTLARRVLTFPVASLSPFETPIAGFALVEVLVGLATAALGAGGERRVERIEALTAEWMTERTLLDPDTAT